MHRIKITFKDENAIEYDNVIEHYCTEKMFYFLLDDGSEHYISLDVILFVDVYKMEVK